MAVKLQTIRDIRNFITSELSGLYPARETESITMIVLSHVLSPATKSQLLSKDDIMVEAGHVDRIVRFCRDLKKGKPVQYVIGETEFYGCRIMVRPGVLIPRPETEELTDVIIRDNKDFSGEIIDIGTGSGAIAIALSLNLPAASVTATDISVRALRIASENARINKARINFIKSDIRNPGQELPGRFDIIVSNAPYVRNSEKLHMNRNVLGYEPHRALFVPDNDPLRFYRHILNFAEGSLKPGGKIYFEINEAMAAAMKELSRAFNYTNIKILKDINGKDRFLYCEKNR